MDTCICGRTIEDRSSRCSRCAALHEIGLENGATDGDIKEAYRAHVKAWHPDRYAGDARQQRVAELKLKKVNAAYDLLNAPEPLPQTHYQPPSHQPHQQAYEHPQQPKHQAPPEPSAARWQEAPPAEAKPEPNPYAAWEQALPPRPGPASDANSSWAHPSHKVSYQDVVTEPEEPEAPNATPAPRSRRLKAPLVYAALFVIVIVGTYFLNTAQLQSPLGHHTDASVAASVPATAGAGNAQAGQTAPAAVPEFFTLGSTKSEVLAVQGQPTSQDDNKFQYGLSNVTFQNDKVVGWMVFPLNPLRVILAPHSHPVSESGYFTLGSVMDEVIGVEGTPSAIWGNTLQYGASSIRFDGDKVSGWDIKPANPLHARIVPTSHVDTSRGYFTSGSSKDEVIAIQGTPTSIWQDTYQWGKSSVTFLDDKVSSWSVYPGNPLHVRASK